jgi:hypothetical protein
MPPSTHYRKIPPSASFFDARNIRFVHALLGVGSPPPEDNPVAYVVCWQQESQSGDCCADRSFSLLAHADKADRN